MIAGTSGAVFIFTVRKNYIGTAMKITDQVIGKLFWWMKKEYGGSWSGQYLQPGELDAAKAAWKKGLGRYNANDIAKVLRTVKQVYPKAPPDMAQFKSMLRESRHCKPGHLSDKLWVSPVYGPNAEKSAQRACMTEIKKDISDE